MWPTNKRFLKFFPSLLKPSPSRLKFTCGNRFWHHCKHNKVIRKVTLSFTTYPLFQWYLQSNEILLNLSMKCSNSAFHARGLKVIIVAVQVRAMKIYVAAVEVLRKNLRKKERRYVKFQFDALSRRNWLFSLPNRLTLEITLMDLTPL